MPHRTAVACAIIAVALHAAPASAHAVKVDQKFVGTELVIVAYFDTDLPADDAEVTLRGADGTVVATGKTDDTGTWKCPKPPPGTYQLRVKVSDTHMKSVAVEIAAAPTAADAVKVDYRVVGNDIVIVAYFDAKLRADAQVTLRGADGSVVASGKTDDTGTWKCPKPAPGTYQLHVKVSDTYENAIPIEIAAGSRWIWIAVVVAAIVALLGAGLWVWRRRKRVAAPTLN